MDESSVVNAMFNSNDSSVSTNRSPDTQGKYVTGMRKPGLCTQNTSPHITVHISFTA